MPEDIWNMAMALIILGVALLLPYGIVLGAIRIKACWRTWRQERVRRQWSRQWETVRRTFYVSG